MKISSVGIDALLMQTLAKGPLTPWAWDQLPKLSSCFVISLHICLLSEEPINLPICKYNNLIDRYAKLRERKYFSCLVQWLSVRQNQKTGSYHSILQTAF